MPAGKKYGGRVAGTPNKVTQDAKRAIASFVDGNADRLVGWLDQIAEKDPEAAFKCFMSVVEYHIPKLNRTESNITHAGQIDYKQLPPLEAGAIAQIEGNINEQYGALPSQLH